MEISAFRRVVRIETKNGWRYTVITSGLESSSYLNKNNVHKTIPVYVIKRPVPEDLIISLSRILEIDCAEGKYFITPKVDQNHYLRFVNKSNDYIGYTAYKHCLTDDPLIDLNFKINEAWNAPKVFYLKRVIPTGSTIEAVFVYQGNVHNLPR